MSRKRSVLLIWLSIQVRTRLIFGSADRGQSQAFTAIPMKIFTQLLEARKFSNFFHLQPEAKLLTKNFQLLGRKKLNIRRLRVQPYNRFTMTTDVIVPTMKDATNVLESCQRSRMGKKRILVTLTQSSDIRYPYYFIFAYFLYFVRRMNTFRANISFLMKDGYSMSLSDLQVGFE